MIKLKCKNPKCNKEWNYKGKADFYATCPNCLRKVKIPRDKDEKDTKNN